MSLIKDYKVNEIIETLKTIEVDGETMEFIVNNVHLSDQILRQLFLKASDLAIENLLEERKSLSK